jgi:hypothetical protein
LAGLLLRADDQIAAQFTDHESLVFDVLWQRYIARANKPTAFCKLLDAVYGDAADGGPHSATLCIYQLVHRIKKKLRPFGLQLYVRDHAVLLCQLA